MYGTKDVCGTDPLTIAPPEDGKNFWDNTKAAAKALASILPFEGGTNGFRNFGDGQQMGMPHRRFQGRTGFIQGRQGKAWVVSVKDGNMQKTVVARPEHLRPLE